MTFYIAISIIAVLIFSLIKFHTGVSKINRNYDEKLENRQGFMFSNRKVKNLRILASLTDYFIENPNIRFIQGLYNLGIISEIYSYNEEPKITLEKLEKIIGNNSTINEEE